MLNYRRQMEPQDTLHQPAEMTPPPVSFPANAPKPRGKKGSWIWVILIVLLAAAIGGFFILKGSSEIEPMPSSTPAPIIEEPIEEETTPAPSASPTATNKSAIDIKVLNGTGIPGEAAYLETQLEKLGYTNIETGNYTSSSVSATTVTFSSQVTTAVKEEITDKLEELYAEVEVKTGSVSGADIQVVVGPRKGSSPKPTASPQ